MSNTDEWIKKYMNRGSQEKTYIKRWKKMKKSELIAELIQWKFQ
ncbi:MAG: hypothetical protein ACTSRU_21580 [Candidatus Hodarchaeales archaeon]